MKKIVCLFVLLFITEGYSQVFNAYDNTVFVVNKPEDTYLWDPTYDSDKYVKRIIYEEKEYAIKFSTTMSFPPPPHKYYRLIRGEETMEVFCRGFGNTNYYIKNIEFKVGKYVLEFDKGLRYDKDVKGYMSDIKFINGKEIDVSEYAQNFMFVNYLSYNPDEKFERIDVYFKDLYFILVDMKDTDHVKLTEVEEFPAW